VYPFMNSESEQGPFSPVRFVVGAVALAAVTLIAFIGVTMLLPARGLTSPPRDIALAVTSPATAGRSADGGSLSREWQPAEPAAAPDSFLDRQADDLPDRLADRAPSNVPTPPAPESPAKKTPAPVTATQPGTQRNATALSGRLLAAIRAEDPEDAQPQRPARAAPRRAAQEPPRRAGQESPRPTAAERNPLVRADATSIQARLQELGYYSGDGEEKGVWGDSSRRALRDFKRMNGLQDDDKWDRDTETQLLSSPGVPASRTFIGRWALNADDCLQRDDGTQLVIDARGAEAASGKCEFRSFKQDGVTSWRVAAACSAPGKSSWSADIGLKLNGQQLQWSSERGTDNYVRCLKSPSKPVSRTAALPHEVLFCSGRCDLNGSVNALKDTGSCPPYCRPGASALPPPPWR
jgi:Putative peptidoglycan binding domain